MNIHIVCSGNAYRSRLAEAYLKSKLSPQQNFSVTSSGIAAKANHFTNGPICWYAMRLLKRHNLITYTSWREHQTTSKILKDVDLLIGMQQLHIDYCQKLGYSGQHEVWRIPDLNEMKEFIPSSENASIEVDMNHIKLTEETFSLIKNKADAFLQNHKRIF